VVRVQNKEHNSVVHIIHFNISLLTSDTLCASVPFGPGATPPSLHFPTSPPSTLSFSICYFSLLSLSYSLHLFFGFPSLSCSTRIVPLHFQAGYRRRRLNLSSVMCVCVHFVICILVKNACLSLPHLV